MKVRNILVRLLFGALTALCLLLTACQSGEGNLSGIRDLVTDQERMDEHVSRDIARVISYARQHSGNINDTVHLRFDSLVLLFYRSRNYTPVWSTDAQRLASADSLVNFIAASRPWGLFPDDYHLTPLQYLQSVTAPDTSSREDAMLWSQLDILLTDAVMGLARDIKTGRLERDSLSGNTDSVLNLDFYSRLVYAVAKGEAIPDVYHQLEPQLKQYDSLKLALGQFLDTVHVFTRYTYIPYRTLDSLELYRKVKSRLYEEPGIARDTTGFNDRDWSKMMRDYQKAHHLKVTGKLDEQTAKSMNHSPLEQFKTIAVNLDRFRQLPAVMPDKYIWVNIPSYYLEVREQDTLVFRSRTVVGKPETQTPVLSSKVTNMITYPQWNIPTSIITKEVLPGVKKDPEYFSKHKYMLLNAKGEEVDPATIRWKKYKKTIPFKVVQGSGDDNALGILKFNFSNPFSVYMHDTNQRYLFGNAKRSLSHGCVRVQEWKKLAHYLLANDSMATAVAYTGNYPPADSLRAWLKRKEKHYLPLQYRVPVYFRYFTAEVVQGRLRFYEDIYAIDEMAKERFFAGKKLDN